MIWDLFQPLVGNGGWHIQGGMEVLSQHIADPAVRYQLPIGSPHCLNPRAASHPLHGSEQLVCSSCVVSEHGLLHGCRLGFQVSALVHLHSYSDPFACSSVSCLRLCSLQLMARTLLTFPHVCESCSLHADHVVESERLCLLLGVLPSCPGCCPAATCMACSS